MTHQFTVLHEIFRTTPLHGQTQWCNVCRGGWTQCYPLLAYSFSCWVSRIAFSLKPCIFKRGANLNQYPSESSPLVLVPCGLRLNWGEVEYIRAGWRLFGISTGMWLLWDKQTSCLSGPVKDLCEQESHEITPCSAAYHDGNMDLNRPLLLPPPLLLHLLQLLLYFYTFVLPPLVLLTCTVLVPDVFISLIKWCLLPRKPLQVPRQLFWEKKTFKKTTNQPTNQPKTS